MLNMNTSNFPGLARFSALGSRLAQKNEMPIPSEYIDPQLKERDLYEVQAPTQGTSLTSKQQPAQAPMMPNRGDLALQPAQAPTPAQGPQEPTLPSPPAMSQLRDVMAAHKNLVGTISDIHRKYRGLA